MQYDCELNGPSLTPAFASQALPALLARLGLYACEPVAGWRKIQGELREFAGTGGSTRVLRHLINPLAAALGYEDVRRQEMIATREGLEDAGYALTASATTLRVWPVGSDIELETPSKRGAATRISPLRRASRILRSRGERVGIVTNGIELRLILCDSDGPDSQVVISLVGRTGWASRSGVPESYRLLSALASPRGIMAAGEIFDAARLHQTAVTKALRSQARAAI